MKHNSEELVQVQTQFNARSQRPQTVTMEVVSSDEVASTLTA
jgi:hypothetical protein